jgi:hypothetical protein
MYINLNNVGIYKMNDLNQIRQNILAEIETLKKDLETIERLDNKYLTTKQISLPINANSISSSNNGKIPGVRKAVEKLFLQFPNKEWKPVAIAKELEKMKANGHLETEAKSMRIAVHGALRNFENKGFIIKKGGKRIPTYKLEQ